MPRATARPSLTAGVDVTSLELDAGFCRKPRPDHLWYVADTGVRRNGQPWLMVTAGDAKVTGDVSTPLMVYKSWEREQAALDPEEEGHVVVAARRPQTPREYFLLAPGKAWKSGKHAEAISTPFSTNGCATA